MAEPRAVGRRPGRGFGAWVAGEVAFAPGWQPPAEPAPHHPRKLSRRPVGEFTWIDRFDGTSFGAP